jgi:hypothetical protein
LPDDKLSAAHVRRQQVEEELPQLYAQSQESSEQWWWQPTVTFVLGPCGRGKTTLMRMAGFSQQAGNRMAVTIPLALAIGRLFREQPPGLEPEELLRRTILRYIFSRFWDVLRNPHLRPAYLAGRRQDPRWMARLRWFYQYLVPPVPQIPDDFELTTWCQATPSAPALSDDLSLVQQFHKLINLITTPPPLPYGNVLSSYHQYVQVFIDSGDDLSQPEIDWLIREVCRLRAELPEKMSLLLLLDSTWQGQAMQAVRAAGGSVACYQLPSWEDSELKELLRRRLVAWGQDSNLQSDWGTLLVKQLEPAAQRKFVNGIVRCAKEAAQMGGADYDAPAHALWLARWLVTRLAEREQEGRPPLALEGIRTYIAEYPGAPQQ